MEEKYELPIRTVDGALMGVVLAFIIAMTAVDTFPNHFGVPHPAPLIVFVVVTIISVAVGAIFGIIGAIMFGGEPRVQIHDNELDNGGK